MVEIQPQLKEEPVSLKISHSSDSWSNSVAAEIGAQTMMLGSRITWPGQFSCATPSYLPFKPQPSVHCENGVGSRVPWNLLFYFQYGRSEYIYLCSVLVSVYLTYQGQQLSPPCCSWDPGCVPDNFDNIPPASL